MLSFIYVLLFVACLTSAKSIVKRSANEYPSCSRRGNLYQPMVYEGVPCGGFKQTDIKAGGSPHTLPCPGGLLFDVKKCVCNYKRDTECSLVKKVSSCTQYGNLYEPITINGVPCGGFTQMDIRNGGTKYTMSCPGGTLFDADVCVCQHAAMVTCPM